MHVGELLRDDGADEELVRAEALEDYVLWLGLARAIVNGGPGEWADRAACHGQTDVMFAGPGESTRVAEALCASCPVFEECDAWGSELGSRQSGVIAGSTGRQRAKRRRQERFAVATPSVA